MSEPLVFNWVNVTTWALRDWELALRQYYDNVYEARGYPDLMQVAERRLQIKRADYRYRVLSWWWKLCTPLAIGDEAPDEVATLLAEEWYER